MGSAVKHVKSRSGRVNRPQARRVTSPLDKAKGYEINWQAVAPIFEAARIFDGPEFVYMIGEADGGAFKLGRSKDPVSRLRQMQTGNPRRLRVEHVLVGGDAAEQMLHDYWKDHRIRSARTATKPLAAAGTEWFEPEAREKLEPVLASASKSQLALIESRTEDEEFGYAQLLAALGRAHGDNDISLHVPASVRTLAPSASPRAA